MIGIGVAFVVFLWLTRSRLLRPMRVLWFAVVLGVVLLVVLPRLEATSTFQQGIVRPGNLTARESYWSIALPILTASPHNFIFGIGTATLETPGLSVGALTPAAVALRPQTFSNSLHSEYVTILVEQGLVGLAAAAFFLLSAFLPVARIARQAADPQCAALAAALVAVAIVMAVDTVFLDPASFSLIMLATGLAAAVSSQRAADRSPLPTSAHAGIRAHAA
jgi:O-antigen ligase